MICEITLTWKGTFDVQARTDNDYILTGNIFFNSMISGFFSFNFSQLWTSVYVSSSAICHLPPLLYLHSLKMIRQLTAMECIWLRNFTTSEKQFATKTNASGFEKAFFVANGYPLFLSHVYCLIIIFQI